MDAVAFLGVKNVSPGNIEKCDLLLFDQIAVPGPWVHPSIRQSPEIVADMEWLRDNLLIKEVSAKAAYSALPPEDPARLRQTLYTILVRMALAMQGSGPENADRALEISRLAHIGAERLLNTSLRMVATHLQSTQKIRTAPVLQSLALSDLRILPDLVEVRKMVVDARSSFGPFYSLESESVDYSERALDLIEQLQAEADSTMAGAGETDTVLEIVLNGLPIPSDATPWEQILDYRRDPASRVHLLALRRWMREVTLMNLQPHELRELFQENLAAFTDHIRLHRMKTQPGTVRTLITTFADAAEHIGKREWGKAVRAFSVHERKISLLEAERSAPGRELAYVVQANEKFSK